MNIGKIPPQAVDVEQIILGSILIEPDTFMVVQHELKTEHFFNEAHQIIYSAIIGLSNRGAAIDMLMVAEELKKNNQLDIVGGHYYISTLMSKVASGAHIDYHVQIIIQKYIRRKTIMLSEVLISKAYSDTVDVAEIISDAGTLESQLTDGTIKVEMQSLSEVIEDTIANTEERVRKFVNNESVGIPTPINALNHYIVGFEPGQFIIIGGRPGHGKTAFSLFMAKHQSKQGFKPAFFTLEMTSVSLANRLIIGSLNIDPYRYRIGNLTQMELDNVRKVGMELSKHDLYISDRASQNVSQIKAEVKKLMAKGQCDIVYVDYLQLIKTGSEKVREQQISAISRGLKLMAKELMIPVVAMSQLSRGAEHGDKWPKLSNLRESGSLEQDTDIVMFIFKPFEYNLLDDENEPYNELDIEIIIAKQREGAVGKVRLTTNQTRTEYYEWNNTQSPSVSIEQVPKTNSNFLFSEETRERTVDYNFSANDTAPF